MEEKTLSIDNKIESLINRFEKMSKEVEMTKKKIENIDKKFNKFQEKESNNNISDWQKIRSSDKYLLSLKPGTGHLWTRPNLNYTNPKILELLEEHNKQNEKRKPHTSPLTTGGKAALNDIQKLFESNEENFSEIYRILQNLKKQ